jgi:lauroyl/myristoyl acyltransferase
MNPVIGLVYSRLGPPLGILLARVLPRPWAGAFADRLADLVTRGIHSPVVRAIRANQAVVLGLPYQHPALDQAVIDVARYAARGYLAFYRALSLGRAELLNACQVEPSLVAQVQDLVSAGRGVIFASAHMGNFDLAFHTLLSHGLSPLVLSYRDPHGSYRADNAIRRHYGLEASPIGTPSLRDAIRRLQGGGLALTGVDRPDSRGEVLRFFGKDARLPIGHARLAVQTHAVIQPGVALADGQGRYRIFGSEPLEPPELFPPREAAKALAQKVLEVLEGYIRDFPAQWLMFFPVWPEVMPSK